jgi:branched-chain amino acid transport system permease protein
MVFLQQLVNGITIGSTYALVAISFTMVFGVLELVNMANGSFYVLGAYLTLAFMTGLGWSFFPAVLASVTLTGGLGALMDRVALSPIRRKKASKIAALISTVGIGISVTNFILVFFGAETKRFPDVFALGKINVGGVIVTWFQIIIFGAAVLMMTSLSLLVYRTKTGKAMRAVAQNIDAAKLMGINTELIITVTFFIGTVCVAASGTMVAMYYQQIDTRMAVAVGMKAFASAVLGGIGMLPGAMLGGILMGVIESLGASYISSSFTDAISFAVLILVLIFRPDGLLGKSSAGKV